MLYEQFDHAADADLFVVGEAIEPAGELVGALNLPRHAVLCHRQHKSSKVILSAVAHSSPVEHAGHGQAVIRGSANIFADLGFGDAVERQVKLRLAYGLNQVLKARKLSQADAAKALGMTEPKISALRHYKLAGFSVERLMNLLTALDQDVEIVIRPKPRSMKAARISVVAA